MANQTKSAGKKGPRKPLRFLIGGVRFGNHNVGDEAILEGIIEVIRKARPNAKISVLTDQPQRTARQFKVRTFKYQFLAPGSGRMSRLLRIVSRIFENALQAWLALDSDVVICGGATMLSDSPMQVLRLACWAVFANKRLVYFPGGMNSGNPKMVLDKLVAISEEFDLFMVRDSDTKARLVEAGFHRDFVHVTVDPAFNIVMEPRVKKCREMPWLDVRNPPVGIGISHEADCSQHNIASEWARIADFIVERFDATVHFIPSNTQKSKDLLIMTAAHSAMRNKTRARVVDIEMSPRAMVSCLSNFEMMISSRMHQLIFSSLAETPFVGVSRCAKTDSFLRLFDMLPASTVEGCTIEKISSSLESVWKERQGIKFKIASKKKFLLRQSLETQRLFSAFLESMDDFSRRRRFLPKRARSFIEAFFMRF